MGAGGLKLRTACQNGAARGSNGRVVPDPAILLAADPTARAARTSAPDAFAFAEVLCAEAPRLRRLVHRLLGWSGATNEVDDVVQETLLAAWRHRHGFRGDASVATWLVGITIRKTRSHARAANVRRRLFAWWHAAATEPVAPADATDGEERLHATHRAMRELGHRDREVLVLRYLEQRDIAQIAQVIGCSRAAVDARLTRARRRLRSELGLEERP